MPDGVFGPLRVQAVPAQAARLERLVADVGSYVKGREVWDAQGLQLSGREVTLQVLAERVLRPQAERAGVGVAEVRVAQIVGVNAVRAQPRYKLR